MTSRRQRRLPTPVHQVEVLILDPSTRKLLTGYTYRNVPLTASNLEVLAGVGYDVAGRRQRQGKPLHVVIRILPSAGSPGGDLHWVNSELINSSTGARIRRLRYPTHTWR